MSDKKRVDVALVERGLAQSREKAQALVMSGVVYIGENKVDKASAQVTPEDELVVRQTLCIVCFAPLSSLAPIYTDRCHSDTALASFTNSVSIAVSLIVMLALGLGFVL